MNVKDLMILYINDVWGERCLDRDVGCPCCQAWDAFDTIFQYWEEEVEITASEEGEGE